MKHTGIIYFILGAVILAYGILSLTSGEGKVWAGAGIVVVGLYFLYRGIATTHNERIRRERENEDQGNDPANA